MNVVVPRNEHMHVRTRGGTRLRQKAPKHHPSSRAAPVRVKVLNGGNKMPG